MRYILPLTAVAFLALATSASASLVISSGNPQLTLPITGNNFNAGLQSAGLTHMYLGGDVTATTGGTLVFRYHGSESGFVDSLYVDNTLIYTETHDLLTWNANGVVIGSVSISAGQKFSDLKINFRGGLVAYAGGIDKGFGIFTPVRTVSGRNRVYLGYDDEPRNADDNHDDIVVSATLVPEPLSVAAWCGLFGAVGLRRALRFCKRTNA